MGRGLENNNNYDHSKAHKSERSKYRKSRSRQKSTSHDFQDLAVSRDSYSKSRNHR